MAIDYINTLGAGAGFNTKELANALVEAERAPKAALINSTIEDAETKISALGEAVSALNLFRSSALTLNDKEDFNALVTNNTQPTAFSVETTASAQPANHEITVSSVARPQRSTLVPDGSSSFSSLSQTLNSGSSFDLTIEVGQTSTTSHTVAVTTATPQGIVDAINAASIGISAQLTDTGTEGSAYVIQIVGASGAEGAYTITPSINNMLTTATASGQTAANASLSVNGVSYSRSTNSIEDIVDGVTFSLNSATSGAANLNLSTDTSALKTKIEDFVSAYNSLKTSLDEITNRELDGALAGDSIFRSAVRSIQSVLTSESSTPGTSIGRLSSIGVSITRTGSLSVTDTTLTSALQNNYDEVRKMFSADTDAQSDIGDGARGMAGDLSKLIVDLTSSSGYLTTKTSALNETVTQQQEALETLEGKMEALQARYDSQFAAMNAVINEMNNTKDNLISSFENLPFTRKD